MSVLGAVLIAEAALSQLQVDVRLRPEDFYLPKHGAIFKAMVALADRSEPVDARRARRAGRRADSVGRARTAGRARSGRWHRLRAQPPEQRSGSGPRFS